MSPAAAASVARILKSAGLKRAIEFRKGIEFEGYWAEPRGDHVRVDYSPDFWIEPAEARPIVEAGLAKIRAALADRYALTEVDADVIYGGNPAMSLPVLEVRNPAWTRRT